MALDDMELVDIIKKIRKVKGLSQADMAEKLGIVVSGYGKIENKKIQLSYERLREIAVIFEMRVEELVNISEAEKLFSVLKSEKFSNDLRDSARLSFFNGQNESKYLTKEEIEREAEKLTDPRGLDEDLIRYKGDIETFKAIHLAQVKGLLLERAKIFDIILEMIWEPLNKKQRLTPKKITLDFKSDELISKLIISEVLSEQEAEKIALRFFQYKAVKSGKRK